MTADEDFESLGFCKCDMNEKICKARYERKNEKGVLEDAITIGFNQVFAFSYQNCESVIRGFNFAEFAAVRKKLNEMGYNV